MRCTKLWCNAQRKEKNNMATASKANSENVVQDILNAGVGFYKMASAMVDSIQKDLNQGFQDLVKKGAADNSEMAKSLRSGLDQGIAAVKDAQNKIVALAAR